MSRIADASDETTLVRSLRTRTALSEGGLWPGLAAFHRVLCQCEFVNKRLEMVDEFNRLKTKAG